MRKRVTTLFLACAAIFSTIAVAPAQAACRPTTLADLFPPAQVETAPTEIQTPVPLVPIETTTTTTSVDVTIPTVTTTTLPLDPTVTTLPFDPTVTTTTTPTDTSAPAPIPTARCSYVYKMNWPVLGGGAVLSVFGADRDAGARRHAGVDISAPKMTPVVAVKDGTVTTIHDQGSDCCWVGITHDDGWSSSYLHLNNDVDGTDDGDGVGIRPDLEVGTRVIAGEVIGWVGDSGNAEPSTPHLHFELHGRNGVAIDPLASLRWAYRRVAPPALAEGPADFSGPYIDDDGTVAESMFGLLTSLGAVTPCDPWSAAVCPLNQATNLDAVTWIAAVSRVLVPVEEPKDVTVLIEQALACPADGCPPPTITVGEAAAILLWAHDQRVHEDALAALEELEVVPPALAAELVPTPYWATEPSVALARLKLQGLADDCAVTSLQFDDVLTRAGLADMVAKAFGYLPIVACGPVA